MDRTSSAREAVPAQRPGFDLGDFPTYLARRWSVFALALGIAIPVVLLVGLLTPKKYTANASILIDPPAGNDPRGSMAISPVYLESLKTYEHFAYSDSLFAKAVQSLGLRRLYPDAAIESLKQRVLKVTKPRDTKVLEISVTLTDPTLARDLAHYIATATVEMNRSLDRASTADLTEGGDAVLAQAAKRLEAAKLAREQALAKEPVAAIEAEVASAKDLKDHLARELSAAQTELAAYESRAGNGKQGPAYMDSETAREAVSASRAEVTSLSDQLRKVDTGLSTQSTVLELRKHHREMLDKELAVAQQQFDAATTQRNEIVESIAFRGERLEIIDPGLVPQKPSSPKIVLNELVAIVASLLGCLFYLAISFGRRRQSNLFD